MKTKDARVRVENYGRENWRTVAKDDSGEWAITGPPYPTRTEALVNVDAVVAEYFGGQMTEPTYGNLPPLVGGLEIAAMFGRSKQYVGWLLDRRIHPDAPEGRKLAGGTFYLESDIIAYARHLGRPVTKGDTP